MSKYAACNVRCAACNVCCCCVEHEHGSLYGFAKGSSAYLYSHIFLQIQVHCVVDCFSDYFIISGSLSTESTDSLLGL